MHTEKIYKEIIKEKKINEFKQKNGYKLDAALPSITNNTES